MSDVINLASAFNGKPIPERLKQNSCGVGVVSFRCVTCGRKYTICPPPKNEDQWQNCLAKECRSYSKARDFDLFLLGSQEEK